MFESTSIVSVNDFEAKALALFCFHAKKSGVYGEFVKSLGIKISRVSRCEDIPLLPIEAFKWDRVYVGDAQPELTFRSSGTGHSRQSVHNMAKLSTYQASVIAGFQQFFPECKTIVAFTPGYEENPDSSLIWMLQCLMNHVGGEHSRFLPTNEPFWPSLVETWSQIEGQVMVFGAAFGLVDLAECHPVRLPENVHIIETGGMKTHRREMSREQIAASLEEGFSVPRERIHSEFGMAEMSSQAYSCGGSPYSCPSWLKLSVREMMDPSRMCESGREGRLGIIDLANTQSCPFILGADRARVVSGGVEILGRLDGAEIRGCNFLLEKDL